MGLITNYVEKNITKTISSTGNALLDKLNGKNKNITTLTFPHNLENQAQSTYMVLYILDNQANEMKFSATQFNSGVEKDSWEIPAITFLKDYAKEELARLKKEAKALASSYVKSAEDWLKQKAKNYFDDQTLALGINSTDLKEAANWVNKWLVPRRVQHPSNVLKNALDPTKNPQKGYQLETAIALQMPSSDLTYSYENGWETHDTATLATIRTLIEGGKNTIQGLFTKGGKEQQDKGLKQLSPVGTKITDALGDLFTGGGFSAERQSSGASVENPVIVFNYKVPEPRKFSYSFTLYPRNKEELYTLYNIIQTIKFYALPEGGKDLKTGGLYLRYPAKFAVKFYTNGYENKWLPSTATLGLTKLEETLTGDNGDMAFFENYFDKNSGNPPRVVRLNLEFTELTLMTREYANSGY